NYALWPDLIPGIPTYISDATVPGGRRLNTAAFLIPTSAAVSGSLGRNALVGFGMYQADVSLSRTVHFGHVIRLNIRVDMFNLTNQRDFANPASSLGSVSATGAVVRSATFGISQSTLNTALGSGGISGGLSPLYQIGGPRSMQLSLKLVF